MARYGASSPSSLGGHRVQQLAPETALVDDGCPGGEEGREMRGERERVCVCACERVGERERAVLADVQY